MKEKEILPKILTISKSFWQIFNNNGVRIKNNRRVLDYFLYGIDVIIKNKIAMYGLNSSLDLPILHVPFSEILNQIKIFALFYFLLNKIYIKMTTFDFVNIV